MSLLSAVNALDISLYKNDIIVIITIIISVIRYVRYNKHIEI